MPRWKFGLRLRLTLGFAVILALSTGAVAWLTDYAAERAVEQVQREQDRVRANRIVVALADFHDSGGNWRGIQEFVGRVSFQTEREIIVLDTQGHLVAESPIRPDKYGDDDHRDRAFSRRHFVPIVSDGVPLGSVSVSARAWDDGPGFAHGESDGLPFAEAEPPLELFAQSVREALILFGAVGGAVGILLVLLLSGRVLGSIGNLTAAARALGGGDLSSRAAVRGNDEIAELGQAFNAMADALEESERQRRAMVSDVAHELRTPLANIQGHIEALQDGLLEPDAATLDTVHQQALHLNRLVDDLRLLAATEARELRLELEPAAVEDIIEKVAASFGPRAAAGSVDLTTDTAEGLPVLNVDRLRIEQVVGNLVDNAIRHTPPGGTVSVAASQHGAGVRVVVADTGVGIPADALPHVFDRLYRADPSRGRATGGTGLGLTIARQLVEAHGGTIWVESEEGAGSRFGIDLPS